MKQMSSEIRHCPNWLKFTSIQKTTEENGRPSLFLLFLMLFCLACNLVPENWHICVNKGLTNLLKIWPEFKPPHKSNYTEASSDHHQPHLWKTKSQEIVLICNLRLLLPIGTLFFRHCYDLRIVELPRPNCTTFPVFPNYFLMKIPIIFLLQE